MASESSVSRPSAPRPGRVSILYNPRVRGFVFQALLALIVAVVIYGAASNAIENLQRAKIASGFGFFDNVAGFDISQRPIEYSATSTYFRAFLVGLLNTLIVAGIGIVLATLLGFVMGIARLSSNWIIARIATIYVETLRNIPLLLQLLFWYGAVLKPLPGPRQSLSLALPTLGTPNWSTFYLYIVGSVVGVLLYRSAQRSADAGLLAALTRIAGALIAIVGLVFAVIAGGLIGFQESPSIFLNNRGLYIPEPVFAPGSEVLLGALLGAVAASLAIHTWAKRRQEATGQTFPVGLVSILLLIGLPLAVYYLANAPVTFVTPELKGFNLAGGLQLQPEFVALLIGLVTYTAAFIAENVRSGILAVSKGQTEAARAVGLNNGQTLRLVVIPQAMRVIIPPLTSQYLNLTKNSSLAVAIGYPDLVQVFTGTVLNQTGQAIEVIAITMLVYLTISLATATFMNWYNRRVALVER